VVVAEGMQAMTGTRLETVRVVDREEVGQEKHQEERLELEQQGRDLPVLNLLQLSEMVVVVPPKPVVEQMVVTVKKSRLSQPRLQPRDQSDKLAEAKFTSQVVEVVVRETRYQEVQAAEA
jgi:hypothetical protein